MNLDKLWQVLPGTLPFVVVGVLLYAGLFIKPAAIGVGVAVPVLAPRDVFYGVAVPQDKVIWAVGRDGKIVRSDDAGETWHTQPSGTDANLQSIVAWDATRALVVGNAAVILNTTDSGHSWEAVANVPQAAKGNKLMRIRHARDNVAYVVGERGLVLQTPDMGLTWKSLGAQEDITWNDIAIHGETLILVGEFGHIRRSVNGGRTWVDIPALSDSSLLGVGFSADGLKAVAVGLEGLVLLSADTGQTWMPVSSGTREHLFDVVDTGTGWVAVGDQGLLLRASAQALSWTAHRLSENDYAWHTSVEPFNGRIYLAGATLSTIDQDNNQEQFK